MNTQQRTQLELLVKRAEKILEKVADLADEQETIEKQASESSNGPTDYVLDLKDLRGIINAE